MVCHETYKDNQNNWLFPDEIESSDGKNFFLKIDKNIKVKVGPSESMSKSKKNIIDPQQMIENYGADSVRIFILSDSPPEKDIQWSMKGMESSYKFIQKLWLLNFKIQNIIKKQKDGLRSEKIDIFTNSILEKITNNLENFSYNVIIANLHEINNFFSELIKDEKNYINLKENYIKILKIMMPIIPHFSSECLELMNIDHEINWPKTEGKYLIKKEFNIVIQINGRKRDIIKSTKELSEKDLIEIINQNQKTKKYLENTKIKKTIYIKNKLINLLT